jgi:hypothetical protein
MPGLRDVVFLGVVGGGFLALAGHLWPPPTRPATSYDAPAYTDADFVRAVARVDAAFEQQWQSAQVKPTRPADDLLIARRLSLGLMGTVPSLEEIRQFEALPPEVRLPWWIDHILNDDRFSAYFAERLARAFVGTEQGPFIVFRRRRFVTWLEMQIAAHRPYDDLVRELIAGTGLWTDHPATNFISVTAQSDKGNQPHPIRLAGRVTRAFLGLRLDCAECHNHPFADWKQSDFQGFAAFFGQTHIGFKGVYDGPGKLEVEDKKTGSTKVVDPAVPFAKELLPLHGTRRQQLAAWVTHPQNPYFAKAICNRVWAIMTGRPLVEPVDNLEAHGSDVHPALIVLADDFASHGFDLRRLIRVIASCRVFRLDSAADPEPGEADEIHWAVFPMTRLRPEQVAGSILQAASVTTQNAESHILIRLARFGQINEFVTRYGDSGEDEFDGRGGTIPQRLLLMNGKMVRERVAAEMMNAIGRIAWMAPEDPKAIETAYLAALSRRPTAEEAAHFQQTLAQSNQGRQQHLEDLFWALVNSAEFSWNH